MGDEPKKLTIFDIEAKVAAGEKVFQVTATDFPTAQLVDRAGIDFILIGDSLGMTALGYPSTVPVTMDEMVDRFTPRFTKRYANVGAEIDRALKEFQAEVREGVFPAAEHSFTIDDHEYEALLAELREHGA
jgi:ketopantoate hydroxymethyltransferase